MPREALYPDCKYIRRCVPIRELALELGLRLKGNMAHCWRPEQHEHGDRTPSVGLHRRKNIACCFVCDPYPLSTIDLAAAVLGLDTLGAIKWIAKRYPVPNIPRGKHLETRQRWAERLRVGTSSSNLEFLVRSGVWACLTRAQQAILPVLDTFAESDTGIAEISYRGLMRYAGVGSQSSVAAALKRFRQLNIVRIERNGTGDGFRACNRYRLTFDDPAFLEAAANIQQQHREEIKLERAFRAEARDKRRKATYTGNTLSS